MLKLFKRLLSLIIIFILILTSIPGLEYDASEAEIIDSIVLETSVSKPESGEALYNAVLYSVNGSTGLKSLIDDEKTYFRWYYSDSFSTGANDYITFKEDAFIGGYAYDLNVKLYTSNSTSFSENCTLVLKTPDGTYEGKLYYFDEDKTYISFDFFFYIPNELKITSQPVSASAANGKYVEVSVEAVGDGVTYQWWIKNPGDTVYTKSSITSNIYKTNMTSAKNGRILRCVIKDGYGNMVKSDIVTITMRNPLVITTQPISTSADSGKYVKVTTEASGDGVTYQWWVKNPGDEVYTKSSITSNIYETNMTSAKSGRILRCVIRDKYGNMVKSDIVTITMRNPLIITKQPVSTSAANGEYVNVTAEASGDGVTYQWWVKNPGDAAYTKSSITSNVYKTNMTKAKSGRILRCVIKDKYGNMTKSNMVTITMK